MDAVADGGAGDQRQRSRLIVAGGSESMSRAPFVMAKATSAFDRNAEMYDTTIGWRFVNPKMKRRLWRRHDALDGRERRAGISASAARIRICSLSEARRRPPRAQENGRFAAEIVPVVESRSERAMP